MILINQSIVHTICVFMGILITLRIKSEKYAIAHMQIRIQQWLHPNRGLKYLWIQNPKIVPAPGGSERSSDFDLHMQENNFLIFKAIVRNHLQILGTRKDERRQQS